MARFATPEVFYAAAMRILAGPGLPGLRIGTLCREVGVTSGSFYHHFGNWDGFVAALLADWTGAHVDRVVALVRRENDPLLRVELLKRLALAVPHEAETAIRGWAATDDVVAASLQRVDARRRDALAEVLRPLIGDERLTVTLAEVGLSLVIGYQMRRGAPGEAGPAVDLAAMLDQFELLVRHHAEAAALEAGLSG